MKHTAFLSLIAVFASLSLHPLLGQIPGAGAPGQGPTTPSTFPGGSQGPGENGPMGTGPQAPVPSRVDDKKFAHDAALSGMSNIELGKLAVQKAAAGEVRQFGQKLLDEETKASDQLKQVTSQENISVPEALDTKHQSQIDKLAKLSGPEFDKAFLKEQLKGQEVQVRQFSDEARGGTDPSVKTFAASTLPNLQQQLELAKNLNKSAKKAKGQ